MFQATDRKQVEKVSFKHLDGTQTENLNRVFCEWCVLSASFPSLFVRAGCERCRACIQMNVRSYCVWPPSFWLFAVSDNILTFQSPLSDTAIPRTRDRTKRVGGQMIRLHSQLAGRSREARGGNWTVRERREERRSGGESGGRGCVCGGGGGGGLTPSCKMEPVIICSFGAHQALPSLSNAAPLTFLPLSLTRSQWLPRLSPTSLFLCRPSLLPITHHSIPHCIHWLCIWYDVCSFCRHTL